MSHSSGVGPIAVTPRLERHRMDPLFTTFASPRAGVKSARRVRNVVRARRYELLKPRSQVDVGCRAGFRLSRRATIASGLSGPLIVHSPGCRLSPAGWWGFDGI